MTSRRHISVGLVIFTLGALLVAGTPLWAQVEPLGHPTVEDRTATLGADPSEGFQFVVFGDQKNLCGGEFPRMLDQIRAETSAGAPLFLLDTGDIVDDGSEADQFEKLRGYLSRVAEMPYLGGVGNHELQPEGGSGTRTRGHHNTAAFLGADYAEQRMFFVKQIGRVRLLFLNTNDLPGIYPDLHATDPGAPARGGTSPLARG